MDQEQIETIVLRARALIRVGRIDDARQLLRALLNKHQNVADAWAVMARIARSREEAIFCLEHLLRLRPGDDWAINSLLKLRDLSPQRGDAPDPVEAAYRRKLEAAIAELDSTLPTAEHDVDPRDLAIESFLDEDEDDLLSEEALAGLMLSARRELEQQQADGQTPAEDDRPLPLDELAILPAVTDGMETTMRARVQDPEPEETQPAAPAEATIVAPEPVPDPTLDEPPTEQRPTARLWRLVAILGVLIVVAVVAGVVVLNRPRAASPPIGDAHVTVLTERIQAGQSRTARIDGAFDAHNYLIEGTAGQQVSVFVEGHDEADPEVVVYSPDGSSELGADDNSGGENNALLTLTLPAEGTYIIRVRMWEPGPYTLSVR